MHTPNATRSPGTASPANDAPTTGALAAAVSSTPATTPGPAAPGSTAAGPAAAGWAASVSTAAGPTAPGSTAPGSGAAGWAGGRRLRASDAEREQVAAILRAAMTEGRLTLEEGEERLGHLYAARFRDELGPVTADLPDGGRPALAETPQARSALRRDLRRHAAVVAGIAVALSTLWLLSGAEFFWPAIPLAFLVMGLIRHARFGHYRYRYSYRHHVAPWNGPGRH
ncbi:MAG TPA: DUF1707 domain-containing protein [Catenuloplanes sp.]|jgi:hypothetical protein